ncbi:hypothetical protein HUT19_22925 [Streptomyces sp. NA02950]|uniref:hypothetical protein n=1 Tax=Streptomyces sp. NA02950 TaxID=2742137 RepID=UPI0015901996|nr:hypothetical protein [Streptomyces sp. NA02950]QKV94257.1 hypothetical protein HUT19_22925 [Streptomyces sp. NA02950]
MEAIGDGPLSDGEFELFLGLLKRFCADELDQWEAWRTPTPYGTVYVNISRGLPPGDEPGMYRPI